MVLIASPTRGKPQGVRGFVGQGMIGNAGLKTTFPLQPETRAYLRAGPRPSFAWKDAVNSLVYRLKAYGVWNSIYAGWLLCAESEAQALANLTGDASKAATRVGTAITLTPGKGYSGGFDGSNYLNFPVSSANLGGPGGLLFGGVLSATNALANSATAIISDSAAPATTAVALDWSGSGFRRFGSNLLIADGPLIGGQVDGGAASVGGSGTLATGGSFAGSFAGLRTGSNVVGSITQFCSLILMPSGTAAGSFRAASAALVAFLYDLGALS